MKKTLTVNISGTVFHIEEDAYEQLRNYLESIRSRLAIDGGRDEIMADIEARIAELFTERLTGRGEVVTAPDVDHVIGIMGKPEDYVGAEDGSTAPPPGYTGGRKYKRLFRDPDDRWLGGVLGGLAAYIGMDPIWLRVIFILFVLLGMGSPILIYVLLWILIPAANTAAERLMMEGEPVTVDNLKKAFEEGTTRVGKDVEDLGKRWSSPEGQRWRARTRSNAKRAAGTASTALLKFIGILLLIVGFSMAIGLIGAIVGGGTFTFWGLDDAQSPAPWELISLLFVSSTHATWFLVAALLLVLIPVVAILLAGFHLLLGLSAPRWLGYSLGPIWIVALFVVIPISLRTGQDLRRSEPLVTTEAIEQPAGDVLYLKANAGPGDTRSWNIKLDRGAVYWDLDGLMTIDDSVHGAWARLDVRRSPDAQYHLRVERRTQGPSTKASLYRSAHISYQVKQNDSILDFSPWLSFPKEDRIRGQRLRFVVLVPEGKAVHFDADMGFMLDDVKNVSNTLDRDMVGRTWTMTQRGLDAQVAPGSIQPETARPDTSEVVVVHHRKDRKIRIRWPRTMMLLEQGPPAAAAHLLPDILTLVKPRT
jgi:phage shock protein PspC (stress-responsive transcriptional regulator)